MYYNVLLEHKINVKFDKEWVIVASNLRIYTSWNKGIISINIINSKDNPMITSLGYYF